MTKTPPEDAPDALDPENDWALGDNDNDDTPCPNCGRFRLSRLSSGNHVCEVCSWHVEERNYAPGSS